MRQPRPVARLENGVTGSAAPTPALAPEAVLNAVSAQLSSAARAVSAATPVLTRAALEARAREGRVTSQEELVAAERLEQMAKLVAILPIQALAHVSKCRIEDLVEMDSSRLAQHVLSRGRQSMWVPNTIKDLKNVWSRFMAWLEQRDIEHDGMEFDAVVLGEFLDHVHSEAKARAVGRRERAAAEDAKAAASAAAKGEPPPPPKKYNDGASAEQGVVDKLKMMERHFGVVLPFEQARARRQLTNRPTMPTPAFTIGIVFRLYAFVATVANEWEAGRMSVEQPAEGHRSMIFHAAVAAAMMFASFSCNRMEQTNNCFFTGETDGFLHGVLRLDKNPRPEKRRARPFWMRIRGFDGKTGWFKFLKHVLSGVGDGCFVFRDFDSRDGDPEKATTFLKSPLRDGRLVHAIECVIMRVCDVTADVAKRWAKHSARHFLMECSNARKVHPLKGVEIGRWSGSTAQDPDLTPSQRLNARHVLEAGKMPETYAPSAKVGRVTSILGEEMKALNNLWEKCVHDAGGDIFRAAEKIPVFGDFSPLQEWMANPLEV